MLMIAAALPSFSGPASELEAAVHDLETRVVDEQRPYVRYLSFYNFPIEERSEAANVASFVLNSVSRVDVLVRPVAVPDTEHRLWRISLADYGLPAEVWEFLASHDPYWHLRSQVVPPISIETTSTVRKANEAKSIAPVVKTVFTDGGWIDLHSAARLRELSQSGGAVLRGDYFLVKATTTLDDGVYYELAGIADDEATFFKSLGLDIEQIDRLKADEGANVIRSLVTFKPRRIVRRQGPLGGAWHTYDTAAATPERDPIRNPFSFVYDAGEHIVAKRNGLHLYALFDAQGKRQAAVPDVIAKDSSDGHGSGIVVPMISCVRCHIEGGLRPIVNDQRRLLDAGVELFVERPKDAQRLASFYLSDLEKKLTRDREDLATATAAATGGMTPIAVSAGLARIVRAFQDELLDASSAALELGVSKDTVVAAFRVSHDPILLAIAAGIGVSRKQWEASFGEGALLVKETRR
ncbi:MAG: hypothetical protein K8U03_06720 [Planctomycetia bacterium]|nr:hypothetical protein [Planctomycetia bacterium]